MKKQAELTESLEDYLEAILALESANKVARGKDIALKMGVKQGSVTGVLKVLKEKGLIHYEPYSFITLTEKGEEIAGEITRRHAILKNFLFKVLGIDAETSEVAACRMEHAFTEETIGRLLRFIEFIHKCPRTGDEWIHSFAEHCSPGGLDLEKCTRCIDFCRTKMSKEKRDS